MSSLPVTNEDLDVSVHGSNSSLPTWRRRVAKTKPVVKKLLPITDWAPKYNLDCLQGDVLAGLTVGLTVIPQGIAYAVVAGVEPTYGLYSSFMGCFVYMFFGSCKDITIGPTAIMSIMTHEYLKALDCGEDESAALTSVAILLTFITGVGILLATILRIGFLVTFIGRTVISAFTSAAAITIATSQVEGLLGLSFESEGFVDTWTQVFAHIGETRYQDVTLGLVSCVALLILRMMKNMKRFAPQEDDPLREKILKKFVFFISVGRNAIIVILCTALAYGLRDPDDPNTTPFKITGNITAGFPTVSVPKFTVTCHNGTEDYTFLDIAGDIGAGLFIVPLIAIIENIAIASAFAGGKAINASQEMLALGMCNFIGSFFQSIPTTGSFSRTAVNSTSGVKTQAGGFFTGWIVILALLFLTPAFKYIPKASLSAVIICAVIFMIEYHDVMPIWRTYKIDQIPLWVTFILCVFWALEWGILVGTSVNICILLYLQATPSVVVTVRESETGESESLVVAQPVLGMMFPSAEHIKFKVSECGLQHLPLLVVLDCTHVAVIDYTSALAVKNLIKEFSMRNQKIAFANMKTNVKTSLLALVPKLEEITLPLQQASQSLVQDTASVVSNQSPAPLLSHPHGQRATEVSSRGEELHVAATEEEVRRNKRSLVRRRRAELYQLSSLRLDAELAMPARRTDTPHVKQVLLLRLSQ
ncbi:SLC26A/SulP transporter domain, partial [Trinorchestia longiramus]